MDIISPKAHRALEYLITLAAGGAAPTLREFDEFADAVDAPSRRGSESPAAPAGGARSTGAGQDGDRRVARFSRPEAPAENLSDQFVRLGWARTIRGGGHLSPTPLAYALLSGLSADPLEPTSVEVVPDPDRPVAYGLMIGRMSPVHDILVVDPFLTLEQFQHLVTLPAVKRVLIKPQDTRERVAFGSILRSWTGAPEVREASGMHDRYVVPRRGDAFMVGAAANDSRHAVALVNLGGFSEDVRVRCERWWEQAKPFKLDGEQPGDPVANHAIAAAEPEPNVLELPAKK